MKGEKMSKCAICWEKEGTNPLIDENGQTFWVCEECDKRKLEEAKER